MTSFETWYAQHKEDLFKEIDTSVDCNLVVYRYLMLAFLEGTLADRQQRALEVLGGYEGGTSS